MGKLIKNTKVIFFVLVSGSVLAMDPPRLLSKKKEQDCVRSFLICNPEKARQDGIPLSKITPHRIIITPDEKAIVAALGNGRVVFKHIDTFDNDIEVVADADADTKGAAMISAGLIEDNHEIVIAIAANHEKKYFYDGHKMREFVARFEILSKKNPYDKTFHGKNTVFTQKRIKRFEHSIQGIVINARGTHVIAIIEFPQPFSEQNRSSLVVYDLLATDNQYAQWSPEMVWWSHLVIHDEGSLVACCDNTGTISLFEIKRSESGISLSAPITIPTRDSISQINYPSKIMMWYVTNDHQLKELDVNRYLQQIKIDGCITTVCFEKVPESHMMVTMGKCPKLSVAFWSNSLHENANTIFFQEGENIIGKKGKRKEMICSIGCALSGSFSCENDSGQRVMEKGRMLDVVLRGNQLVAVVNSGCMRVFKLIERCGLVIKQRSKSAGFVGIPRSSGDKSVKLVGKEGAGDNIIAKTVSMDDLSLRSSQERQNELLPSKKIIQKSPLVRTSPLERCAHRPKETLQRNSVPVDVPPVRKPKKDVQIDKKDTETEYQKALFQDILSDHAAKDRAAEGEIPSGK